MPDTQPNDDAQFYSDLLRIFFDSTNDAIFVLCDEMKFITCNKITQDWLGISEDELTEHNKRTPITELLGNQAAMHFFESSVERALKNESVIFETQINPVNGQQRWIELSMKRVDLENGDMVISVARDISERKKSEIERERLQRELNQARKMEALGQLTGGIAHDFNNILAIISGYSELALNKYQNQSEPLLVDYLKTIKQSTDRAKKIISQMMVFCRSDIAESQPLQLAPLIEEDIRILHNTLPDNIEFETRYEKNIPDVLMDASSFQQLLLNLYINARDAMNDNGKISVSLGLNQQLNHECSSCHKQIDGEWVELIISDTGSGMSPDIVNRIFDPFFTTKAVGKGTGMGMAMVGSIIEHLHGHIIVESEIGRGTRFRLLFPPAPDHCNITPQSSTHSDTNADTGQGESVLIIDDERELASFISDLLEIKGYRCQSNTSSREALALYQSKPDEFDLVITDQAMPELSGNDIITAIRKIKPEQAIILASGYSESESNKAAEGNNISYIQKPFSSHVLLKLVKQALNSRDKKD